MPSSFSRPQSKQDVGEKKRIRATRYNSNPLPLWLSTLLLSFLPSFCRSISMAIHVQLAEAALRNPLGLGAVAAFIAAGIALLSVGPSFSAVATFFWPLLLSTGFLLIAVAVILRISPPPPSDQGPSGEDLIDYVSGRSGSQIGYGDAGGDGGEQRRENS